MFEGNETFLRITSQLYINGFAATKKCCGANVKTCGQLSLYTRVVCPMDLLSWG